MSRIRIIARLSLLCVPLLLLPMLASPASASTSGDSGQGVETSSAIVVRYKLLNKSKVTNYTRKSQIIARCAQSGGKCTLTQFADSTRAFGVALGVSNKAIASNLSISASRSVTVGASAACTSSRKLKANEVLVAYPLGSLHKYKVQRTVAGARDQASNGTTVSGWRYTFNPYKVGIDCKIVKK